MTSEFGLVESSSEKFPTFVKNLLTTYNIETSVKEVECVARQLSKQSLVTLRKDCQDLYHVLTTHSDTFSYNRRLATHLVLEKEVKISILFQYNNPMSTYFIFSFVN